MKRLILHLLLLLSIFITKEVHSQTAFFDAQRISSLFHEQLKFYQELLKIDELNSFTYFLLPKDLDNLDNLIQFIKDPLATTDSLIKYHKNIDLSILQKINDFQKTLPPKKLGILIDTLINKHKSQIYLSKSNLTEFERKKISDMEKISDARADSSKHSLYKLIHIYPIIKGSIAYCDSISLFNKIVKFPYLPFSSQDSVKIFAKYSNTVDSIYEKQVDVFYETTYSSSLEKYESEKELLNNLNHEKAHYDSLKMVIPKDTLSSFQFRKLSESYEVFPGYTNELADIESEIRSGINLKSLSESEIIDALGTFIYEQFLENITYDVFNNFIQDMEQLKYIFPKTFHVAYSIRSQNYFVTSIGKELRNSMEDDLRNILKNFFSLEIDGGGYKYKNDFAKTLANKYPKLFNLIVFAIDIFDNLKSGIHPYEIISYLAYKYNSDEKRYDNLYKSFSTLNIVLQNLREVTNYNRVWIKPNSLLSIQSEKSKKYFICLLLLAINKYSEGETYTSSISSQIKNLQSNFNKYYNEYENTIFEILFSSYKLESTIIKLKNPSLTSVPILLQYEYFNNFYDFIVNNLELINKFNNNEQISSNDSAVFRIVSDVYKSISTGEYSTILISTLNLLSFIEQKVNFPNICRHTEKQLY